MSFPRTTDAAIGLPAIVSTDRALSLLSCAVSPLCPVGPYDGLSPVLYSGRTSHVRRGLQSLDPSPSRGPRDFSELLNMPLTMGPDGVRTVPAGGASTPSRQSNPFADASCALQRGSRDPRIVKVLHAPDDRRQLPPRRRRSMVGERINPEG